MTTIIIIVVVALVFFVTVCVVTFMVWKRETEIRTDSIRAIESNLESSETSLQAMPAVWDPFLKTAALRETLCGNMTGTADLIKMPAEEPEA